MGRSTIPQSVKYELWARAAGRCEFRGCNKLVYLDEVSMRSSNLAWLSHIVAASPDGPRGDPERSETLAADLGNLMLTCRDHGKVIDDRALVSQYPEELLREFKKEHERRIKVLTSVQEESKAHVVIVCMAVRGTGTAISSEQAHRALLPLYAAEEQPLEIDLSDLTGSPSTEGYLELVAGSLSDRLREHQLTDKSVKRYSDVALFALGPIPLLAHLGRMLGHLRKVHLFQRHPDTQSWRWPDREEALGEFYEVKMPESDVATAGRPVALVLSTSSRVGLARFNRVLDDPLLYEIRANEPSRDFLKSPTRLEMFGVRLRQVLEQIRTRHPVTQPVHVFAAVQAPLAVELGRNLRSNDPPFVIYEYDDASRCYRNRLAINEGR